MKRRILLILVVAAFGLLLVNAIFNNIIYTTFKNTVVPLDSFTNYPRASDYGLKENDESAARFNGDLMKAAISEFGGIIVDGRYHMKLPSNSKLETVGIIGDKDYESELIFSPTYSTVLFDSAVLKDLYISDVKFVNTSNDDIVIARQKSALTSPIDSVVIQNSVFEGNLSAYRLAGDGSVDPNSSDFVLNQFVFDNNVVSNTNFTFLVLEDIPYNSVSITNNTVTNFQYVFANLQLSNDNDYNDELFQLRKELLIRDNYVTSEDNWWSKGSGSMYHAFVVAEGDRVEYSGNHVEGLKSDVAIALYDVYLSCNEVIYENNTWKNNVAFDPDKKYSAFMKSKNGSEPLYRVYRNNEFIIEESFAEKYGMDLDSLVVDFISLENHAEYYEISNNTFEGYYIRFPKSSRFIENLVFENNEIRADRISGSIVHLQVNEDFEQGSIEFSDNIIIAQEHLDSDDSILPLFKFYNYASSGNEPQLSLVDFTNNKIYAPYNYLFLNVSDSYFQVDYNSLDANLHADDAAINSIFNYKGSDKIYRDKYENVIIIPNNVTFSLPSGIFDDLEFERLRKKDLR